MCGHNQTHFFPSYRGTQSCGWQMRVGGMEVYNAHQIYCSFNSLSIISRCHLGHRDSLFGKFRLRLERLKGREGRIHSSWRTMPVGTSYTEVTGTRGVWRYQGSTWTSLNGPGDNTIMLSPTTWLRNVSLCGFIPTRSMALFQPGHFPDLGKHGGKREWLLYLFFGL